MPPLPGVSKIPPTFLVVTNDGRAFGGKDIDPLVGTFAGIVWEESTGLRLMPGPKGCDTWTVRSADPWGKYIVGVCLFSGPGYRPYIWLDPDQEPILLFDVPLGEAAETAGVSWSGAIIGGGYSHAGGYEAFLFTWASAPELLGDLPGGPVSSLCAQLPEKGDVVLCCASGPFGQQPARWTRETGWQGIDPLPGGSHFGNLGKVNRDGRVGAGRAEAEFGQLRPVRWTARHGLHSMIATGGGTAKGVSGDGWVVVGDWGGASPTPPTVQAFIWDPLNGTRTLLSFIEQELGLSIEGRITVDATAISENGRYIVGTAGKLNDPNFPYGQGFLLEMPPFCYADCDQNKALTIMDYLCYMDHYQLDDLYANCNNDANLDIFDIICFSDAYAKGCP